MHWKIKRRAALAAGGAIAATMAIAGPAAAAPTGCYQYHGGTMTYASCSGGTGSYQVWAQCRSEVWPHFYSWAQSSWVKPPSTAWAFCEPLALAVQSGLSTRNY